MVSRSEGQVRCDAKRRMDAAAAPTRDEMQQLGHSLLQRLGVRLPPLDEVQLLLQRHLLARGLPRHAHQRRSSTACAPALLTSSNLERSLLSASASLRRRATAAFVSLICASFS